MNSVILTHFNRPSVNITYEFAVTKINSWQLLQVVCNAQQHAHILIFSCPFFLSVIYYMILMSCMYQSSCLMDINSKYQSSFLMYGICMFNNMYHNQHLSIATVHIPRIHTICTYFTYSCHVYILHVFILCVHIPRIHVKYS